MASFQVVYDTCVLVPAPLCDFLLRAAEQGLVRASMSHGILQELQRVLARDFMPEDKAQRRCEQMGRAFEDAVVARERYEGIKPLGLPDPDDEHVVAAARAAVAQGIVTFNTKDFPSELLEPFDLEVLHPDGFVLDLIDLFPVRVVRIIETQAARLRHPPKTYEEVLEALERSVPESVARLREL